MSLHTASRIRFVRDASITLALYVLPVAAMFAWLHWTGQVPAAHAPRYAWLQRDAPGAAAWLTQHSVLGLTIVLAVVEGLLGLYDERWDGNEKKLDLACFVLSRFLLAPAAVFVAMEFGKHVLPGLHNTFAWVPFVWGFLILVVADDLTQYWYHRLHHQIPWLWRFHRTHHSAPYMGMAMASRQNAIYTFFFSQTYVTVLLVFAGLGPAALAMQLVKGTITTLAHSCVPWDKPLYRYKVLHPVAWVLERLISTPATHHAHHAASTTDGVGYYKGNFGNMLFLWDVIFGTAHISRRYPAAYGISHYEKDPWAAQLLWPLVKSGVAGSELSRRGPVVREDPETV